MATFEDFLRVYQADAQEAKLRDQRIQAIHDDIRIMNQKLDKQGTELQPQRIEQTEDKITALDVSVRDTFDEHAEMIRRLEERLDAIQENGIEHPPSKDGNPEMRDNPMVTVQRGSQNPPKTLR